MNWNGERISMSFAASRNRTLQGLDNLRRNIAEYPFICYTRGIKYPLESSVLDIQKFKRFELKERTVWMFIDPVDMRTFKRQFVSIDNSV